MKYSQTENESSNIAHCEYFTTNYLPVSGIIEKNYGEKDSFVICMCVSEKAEISTNGNTEAIEQGQTVLIPAVNKKVQFSSKGVELLEVYID